MNALEFDENSGVAAKLNVVSSGITGVSTRERKCVRWWLSGFSVRYNRRGWRTPTSLTFAITIVDHSGVIVRARTHDNNSRHEGQLVRLLRLSVKYIPAEISARNSYCLGVGIYLSSICQTEEVHWIMCTLYWRKITNGDGCEVEPRNNARGAVCVT